jgi:hypothetical protein
MADSCEQCDEPYSSKKTWEISQTAETDYQRPLIIETAGSYYVYIIHW